jgi:hypothetical protein
MLFAFALFILATAQGVETYSQNYLRLSSIAPWPSDILFLLWMTPWVMMLLPSSAAESGGIDWRQPLAFAQVVVVALALYLYFFHIPSRWGSEGPKMVLRVFQVQIIRDAEILGTDLSTRVLAQAKTGKWNADRISSVPREYQRRFLLKGFGPEKGKIKVADEVRKVIRFQRVNLTQEPFAVTGPFDLIFCRNVLIYFQWETKIKVVDSLGKYLSSSGYLFLGHAESLHSVVDKLQFVAPRVLPSAKSRTSALCILQRREQVIRD